VRNGRFLRRAGMRAAMSAAGAAALSLLAGERGRATRRAGVVAAATAGAAMEMPVAAAVVGTVGVVLLRRERFGLASVSSMAAGAGVAAITRRVWPVAPRVPAESRPALTPSEVDQPSEDGDGLTIIVNPSAGPALRKSPTESLKEGLPAATVLEANDSSDLTTALERAATSSLAVGVAGGDGSIGAAAAIAHAIGKPLVVVPTGTLNHLARDLGIGSVDDAVDAVRAGRTVRVDVGTIDGETFLNTASFGAYSKLVDARERLESRIGKWPAVLVALFHVLRHSEPVAVELDGSPRLVWMIFVGNCVYQPAGFAPSWRERLDDGLLDIRIVDASQRFARTRLLLAVATGRLGHCRVYEARTATTLRVRSLDGPLRLARDGETFDGPAEFEVRKEPRPLAVYVP
jgi:diacylglycerol kinase family enzyme